MTSGSSRRSSRPRFAAAATLRPNASASTTASRGNSNGRLCEWIAISRFHPGRGVLAEHARHVAQRLRSARRLLDQLDQHDLAGARACQVPARHEDAVADARIVGDHEADAGLLVQAPDDLVRVALENLDDRALRPAAVVLTAEAYCDAVAVHGFQHLARREEHRRRAIVRQHEAVAVAMSAHRTDDERQPLAQAVLVAAIADYFAGVQQFIELGLQPLVRRFAVAPDALGQLVEIERPPGLAQRHHDASGGGRGLRARTVRSRGMTAPLL